MKPITYSINCSVRQSKHHVLNFRNRQRQNYREIKKDCSSVDNINDVKDCGKSRTFVTFLNLKSHIEHLLKNSQDVQLERTSSGQTVVYTDGSCLSNNSNNVNIRKSGIGVYWGSDNHPFNLAIPHGGSRLTSVRAEIASAHAAVLLAKSARISELCLRTDSKLIVDIFTRYLPRWKANNWVSEATGRPVKNQDMLKRLCDDLRHVRVEFQYRSDACQGIRKAHCLAQKGANLS